MSDPEADYNRFVEAAWSGDKPTLFSLIDTVPVDCVDKHGDTALVAAAIHGHVEITNALIKRGANVNHRNRYFFTALHWAAEGNHIELAQFLIQSGADVNLKDNAGNTALHIAAKAGSFGVLELLLSSRSQDTTLCNNKGETPLLLATAKTHSDCVDVLIRAGVDVDASNVDGASPLLMAAWVGDVNLCEKLIQAGANVNHIAASRGDTPLLLASYREHSQVVELLVANGAKLDVRNLRGAVVNGNKSPAVEAAIVRGLELHKHKQRVSNIYDYEQRSPESGDVDLNYGQDQAGTPIRKLPPPSHMRVPSNAPSNPPSASPNARGPRYQQHYQAPPLDSVFPPKNRATPTHERTPSNQGYGQSALPRNNISESANQPERKQSYPPAPLSAQLPLPSPLPSPPIASPSNGTIEAFMDEEFAKIVGMNSVKESLRAFYKKVQLDRIREMAAPASKLQDGKRLYHMIFTGPPGVGKTTMANLVAKVMLKMGLLKTDRVEIVSNAMDLVAGYVGQTPSKVDAKVEEAKGGVLFIDEAYSIVKQDSSKDGFGKEAIDTIMKHLDPPSCVFIFAGYEAEMNRFLAVNEGLQRRLPYRYHFEAYTIPQLIEILKVMCVNKDEDLEEGVCARVEELLETEITDQQRATQNAGLIANWISFAQNERDDRLDLDEAREFPDLASLLTVNDFEASLSALKKMAAKSN